MLSCVKNKARQGRRRKKKKKVLHLLTQMVDDPSHQIIREFCLLFLYQEKAYHTLLKSFMTSGDECMF